ncbi:ATP-binding protein [Halobaculum sp. CBA1158]|uniref:ATP-binding protein n=1 Tax=Halobaculum sp. CBA1158 TaxID=2904243 RepID=UPI001F1EE8A1|nr:ATP-binding protein [Halobaculum sp. CBA1158]UIP00182.1 ATP-binding protein [Halobaculum sp. CBA1158]
MIGGRFDWDAASAGTTLFGAGLVLATGHHHLVREPIVVDGVLIPALAFVLDGSLAAGVAVAGGMLARSEFDPKSRRTIAAFGVATGAAFTLVIGVTMAIRIAEGRAIAEPEFVLFTSVGSGFLIGAAAGTYRARSQEHARSASRGRDALAFVNGLLRHDIRNDATVIAGYAERIDDEEARIVHERANRVVERTEHTQTVARTIVGEVDPDPLPLAPLVERSVESATTTYPSATVSDDVPEGITVRANEAFEPVLDNLIENAIEHNDGDPSVRVDAERDGDRVRVRVVDDGPGIAADERDSLFDHEVSDAKGLNVVATVVDGLGGDVRVREREPRGTAVVVTLPAGDAGSNGGDAA